MSSRLGLDQDAECTREPDTNDLGVTTSEAIIEDEQGVALVGDGERLSFALSEIGGQRQQCQRGRRDNSCPRKSGNIGDVVSCSAPSVEFLTTLTGTSTCEYSAGSRSMLPSWCRYSNGEVLLTTSRIGEVASEV